MYDLPKLDRRSIIAIAAALIAVPLIHGCGDDVTEASSDSADELTPVTLRLDWTLSGQQAPFILAEARGFYADAGIDIKIDQGSGSADGAKLVGTKQIDFAVVDASVIGSSRQEGLPIKSVAVLYQRTPVCVLWVEDRTSIDGPESLVGSDIRVGINEKSAHAIGFRAMLDARGFDENDVNVVPIGQGTSALLAGQLDAMGGMSNVDPPVLEHQDVSVGTLQVADYGVKLYGLSLASNEQTINDNPGLVKAFVEATLRGWEAAEEDPDAAIDALLNVYPEGDKDLDMSILQATLALAKGDGLGAQTEAGWDATAKVLVDTGITDDLIPAEQMYSTVAVE